MAKLWDDSQGYNAIGRSTSRANNTGSGDNFITKKIKSAENAIGTTAASIVSPINNEIHNAEMGNMLQEMRDRRQSVANKYGYADIDALYTALDEAEANGDAETANRLFQAEQEDRALTSDSANKIKKSANEFNDYLENSWVSKKIDQDRGKFAGSAINTLSTATDILGLTSGPVSNAIQGGIEGVADELEQNGLENFSWERAGQNAAIGAASGAASGLVNKGVSNQLAKNGGNLFKGSNKLTRGINNLGSSTAAGRIGSTLATGAGRGAIAGAAGGAAGGAVGAGLNGQNILGGAAQGALQGARQGAVTGTTLAGANMIANKTPGVGTFLRNTNQAADDWRNSGTNFKERLYNTVDNNDTWGTRFVGNRIDDARAVKQGFQNVGEGIGVIADRVNNSSLRNIGGTLENVSETPEAKAMSQDIQNMNIKNNTESPETEVYRTVMGETEEPLAYGESGLATGKTRKQNILSKAGRAMEAAQVNATRKETRDIGIDNAGELVNKVRQRTGLSDLETQAAFAKELTGGENSLLDNIQRSALAATEDGSIRTADLEAIMPKVNKLVDDAPNTLISPSKKASIKEAILADLTNPGIDTITKANNFKAAAAQQYLINERTPNDSAKELGKLYTRVGDLVDEASYAAVPQDQVEIMFETAAKEARGRAQTAAKNGNKATAEAYNRLAAEAETSPKTIQAFRSLKKDYVDISKLNKKTQQGATAWNNSPLAMGTAITAAMATGNPLVAVPAAWAAKTLAPAVGQMAIDASAKAGGKLADWGDAITARKTGATLTSAPTTNVPGDTTSTTDASYNPSTQLYNVVGRNVGRDEGEKVASGYIEQAAQAMGPVTVGSTGNSSTALYNNVMGNAGTNTATNASTASGASANTVSTPADYYTNILATALNLAAEANDVAAFGTLYEMYNEALANQQSTSTSETKLTDKQRQANAAARALEDMENAENNFGFDVSDLPILGSIANARGNDYKSKAEALALQIGYMLSGATVNKDEAKKIGESYVPQPRESEAERKRKLAQLRGIISDYQKTYAE